MPFVIPKRSPDLNVCDYALWKMVNKRMRAQEKSRPDSKKETRAEFLIRLRRTAMRLPSSFVQKSIGDMKRRCEMLKAAQGYHFEKAARAGEVQVTQQCRTPGSTSAPVETGRGRECKGGGSGRTPSPNTLVADRKLKKSAFELSQCPCERVQERRSRATFALALERGVPSGSMSESA